MDSSRYDLRRVQSDATELNWTGDIKSIQFSSVQFSYVALYAPLGCSHMHNMLK